MPPTDKTLAVMTPKLGETNLDAIHDTVVTLRTRWPKETALVALANRLSEIESVVRYLVDHPERLAGEDEVVVKQEELQELDARLHKGAWWSLELWQQCAQITYRWLAGSPTAQESKDK